MKKYAFALLLAIGAIGWAVCLNAQSSRKTAATSEAGTRHTNRLSIPEDFGAVGDGKTDDWKALNDFFNSWKRNDLQKSVALALTPGKVYCFSKPLIVTTGASKPNGVANFRLILHGNGATLRYTGGRGKGYAFRFGELNKAKGNRCSVYDTHFSVEPEGADGILLLDHHDFSVWQNVSAQGKASEACIKINRGYSLSLHEVFASGGDIGLMVGQGNDGSANAFRWCDGRVLKCRVGLQYSGTTFKIENVDFSSITEACVDLHGAQYGSVHLYTELNGPETRANDAAIVRVKNSRSLRIDGMLNASHGALNRPRHAGYCVDVSGSSEIVIAGRGYMPQTAFVRMTDDCRNIIIAEEAICDFLPFNNPRYFPTAQPAPFADGIKLINRGAIRLLEKSHPGAPTSLVRELSQWERDDSIILSDEAPDYRGDGKAMCINFPHRDTKTMRLTANVDTTPGNYRLEARLRLLRFSEPDRGLRKSDTAAVYLAMNLDASGESVQKDARIGEGWQDVWADLTTTQPGALELGLGQVRGCEPAIVAVDFVRLHKQ